MSTIKIICLWTTSLFTSVLSCIPHTLSWSVCTKCFTCNTHSAIRTPSGYQLSVLPKGLTALLGQETEWKRKIFFSTWGGKVSYFSKCSSLPPLACNSFLPPTAASWNQMYCTLYVYSKSTRMYTQTPPWLSLLCVDCIRKCSQAWNGSFDAFSSDVPCMKKLHALAPE